MKILIISDTHGKHENLRQILFDVGDVDMLIHCGDTEGGEHAIMQMAGCPCRIVSGNNDFFSRLPAEEEFEIGKYKAFLTHGHYYGISMGYEKLLEEASFREADIAFFGHTHRPVVMKKNGIFLVNPGSVSYPRQEGRLPSYCIMELDREGEAHFTLNYLS